MISATKQGWLSELLVAADLTKAGYDVYLGFSGHYDMIAVKSEMRYTVEVKTVTRFRPDWHRISNKPDLIALVSRENEIRYFDASYQSIKIRP